jgi:NitT/TauT family transport system permease protein
MAEHGRAHGLRASDALLALGAFGAGIAIWWITTAAFSVPPFLLPSPVDVASLLIGNPGLYARNALFTLEKILYGGTVGVVGGFVLAICMAYLPWFRRAIYPYLVTARVLPKIAIAPVLLIYLGTGMGTAVVFVALIAFFPLVLSTVAGLDRTPAEQHALLRSVNADPIRTIVHVDLRYALPDVFAGLKQSVTLSVIGAVVAEWIVADDGLGFLILLGSENVRADVMIAALFVLLVLGLSLYAIVAWIQRRFFAYELTE